MFIVCIYSHVRTPVWQESQTHMLMVTRYWPGVITREWWVLMPTGELIPYLRSSLSHHVQMFHVARLLHLSEDAITSDVYVKFPDFKTLCVRWSRSFGYILPMASQFMTPNIRHLLAPLLQLSWRPEEEGEPQNKAEMEQWDDNGVRTSRKMDNCVSENSQGSREWE